MKIYRGQHKERVFTLMGSNKFYETGSMACSCPEGVADGLVCDADIYGVRNPAEYLRTFFKGCSHSHEILQAVIRIQENVRGAYACGLEHGRSVYIFRDPIGFRPLYYEGEIFASEKGVLSTPVGLLPGELVRLPGTRLFCKQFKEISTVAPGELLDVLTKSMHQCMEKNTAILFSGGIDSSILAVLSDAPLFTCGLEGSQDILFSREAGRLLKKEIQEFIVTEKDIKEAIPEVLSLIEEKTLFNLELGLLLYFACRECDNSILISGQGADELFGGYYKYKKIFNQKGDIKALMRRDLEALYLALERDGQIAERFTKTIRYPYLALSVVERALGIPAHYLFTPQRKAFLRKVASLLVLPEKIISRPKKALQYGSGIHRIVRKMDIKL